MEWIRTGSGPMNDPMPQLVCRAGFVAMVGGCTKVADGRVFPWADHAGNLVVRIMFQLKKV